MGFVQRLVDPPLDSHKPHNNYLIGVRGLLTIQSFLYVFLVVFAPVAVVHSKNTSGPGYLQALRKTLSVIFWNDSLIYSGFILVSARTICIPFLEDGTKTTLAGCMFRRSIRLAIPVAVSLAVVTIVFSQTGVKYIQDFMTSTENISIAVPYEIENALIYFNSVFNLFWVTTKFAHQAGNLAFPSQTIWTVNVIYMQRRVNRKRESRVLALTFSLQSAGLFI